MRASKCFAALAVLASIRIAATPVAALQPQVDVEQALDAAQQTLIEDTEGALSAIRRAKAIARGALQPSPELILKAAWLEAEALYRLNRLEESADVLTEIFQRFEPTESELYGKLLISKGRVANAQGRNGEALQALQQAHDIFAVLGNKRYQAISLQTIAILYYEAWQFERALRYDERARSVYDGDPAVQMGSLNLRAVTLRRLERFGEARSLLKTALDLDVVRSSPRFQVRIGTNLALIELLDGNNEGAREAVDRVMDAAKSTAAETPHLLGVIRARLLADAGDLETAVRVLDETFSGTDTQSTGKDDRDAHALAYPIYAEAERTREAIRHLEAYKRLDDASRQLAASANLAFLNAEFELSNKELEIERLRSDRLEADVALIDAQRRQGQLITIAVIVLAAAFSSFLIWQTAQSRRVRKLTEGLNRKLESANAQLLDSNVRLQEANSAKTEFLATISHEVRTPLNAVMNLTEAVLEEVPSHTEAADQLRTALRSAEHLRDIVSDVLDVARFEGKRIEPRFDSIAIEETISDVANLWRPKAQEKDIDFLVDTKLDQRTFCTDDKLIRQLLSNLLSNAIKFTPHGSVHLYVSGGSAETPLTIRISDTGIGIDPKDQDVIFESFRQVDSGGTRSYGGTGLGLAICRQIAELLGGSIAVDSAPGAGTTFTVSLPYRNGPGTGTQPKAPTPSQAPRPQFEALASLHVLAAEDNAVNAMVIQAILKGKVAGLTIVENGREAVNAVRDGDFDIVLMDKQMPVMDGVEATRQIRQLGGSKGHIPIIAVTADAFEAARTELLDAGADHYLSKPIKPDELKAAILTAMEKAAARRAVEMT